MRVKKLAGWCTAVALLLAVGYARAPLDFKERRSIQQTANEVFAVTGLTPDGRTQTRTATTPSCAWRMSKVGWVYDLTFTTFPLPPVTTRHADALQQHLARSGFDVRRTGDDVAGIRGDDLTVSLEGATLRVTAGPCADDPAFLPPLFAPMVRDG